MKQLQPKMRDVMALAANPTSDGVSGYNFRSPEEVMVVVKSLEKQLEPIQLQIKKLTRLFGPAESAADFAITFDRTKAMDPKKRSVTKEGITVEPIDIKNIRKLEDNFGIIKLLNSRLEALDSIQAQYLNAFGSSRTKLVPAISETRKKYESELRAALALLKKIAKQHEPKPFQDIVIDVMNAFYGQMKNAFDKASQYAYVTTRYDELDGPPSLVFNHYVEFQGLRNDAQDYVYPQYFIIFTAIISPSGKMKLFVNTLHKFRAPGTFKPGYAFLTAQQGITKLAALLSTDEFIDLLERSPLPIEADDIDLTAFSAREVIDRVDIVENVLRVTFTAAVTEKNKKTVAEKVLVDIHRLLAGKTSSRIKYKLRRVSADRYQMEFVLVLPAERDESELSPDKLDRLREEFGFDDQDLLAIQSIMRRGHA